MNLGIWETVSVLIALMLGLPVAKGDAADTILPGEMNCTDCHAASKTQASWLFPKAAPKLADIGKRANPDWVRKHVLAPQCRRQAGTGW